MLLILTRLISGLVVLRRGILSLFCLVAICSYGEAADIRPLSSRCFVGKLCHDEKIFGITTEALTDSILISGEIVRGDSERLLQIIKKHPGRIRLVFLRSEGGSVDEAMKIGRVIRASLIETEAPKLDWTVDERMNYTGGERGICFENGWENIFPVSRYGGTKCTCVSACFLIYASGVRKNIAFVGFHRVFLPPEINRSVDFETSMRALNAAKLEVISYMKEMGVLQKYVDRMFGIESRDIHYLTYSEVTADFLGWVPEIEEWLMARCQSISDKKAEMIEQDLYARSDAQGVVEFRNRMARRDSCYDEQLDDARRARQTKVNIYN